MPAATPPPPEVAPARPEAPPLTPLTGNPVDWFFSFPDGPTQSPPLTTNACRTDGESLQVDVRSRDWQEHPLSPKFQVPSAVVVACNSTQAPMKSPRLELDLSDGTGVEGRVNVALPDLAPGQAVGPLRVFATGGLPASVKAVGLPLPTSPTLEQLRSIAWSQVKDGDEEFFLYASDTKYSVQTDAYCGAMPGEFNASADAWAVYRSAGGGTPSRLVEIGQHSFPGGRGLAVRPAPQIGTTFFFLADYGSCANPTFYRVYAYDQQTGRSYRPQIERKDGSVTDATVGSFTLAPDGRLTSKSYSNAGDSIGWNTYTYTWDAKAATWRLLSHTRE